MSKASIALRGSACIWRACRWTTSRRTRRSSNALQRRADVVVQKSPRRDSDSTVAESMWKARPVVASRIGGIQDQIVDGISGILLDNPTELGPYGDAVAALLQNPDRARSIGQEARERVRDEYLAVRSLMQYLDLIARLLK